jgi:DNA primase large subunit
MVCGLEHPYEFYSNYVRHLPQLVSYKDVGTAEQAAVEAFVAFMKGTASCPEEEEELQALTPEDLYVKIEAWYTYKREQRKTRGEAAEALYVAAKKRCDEAVPQWAPELRAAVASFEKIKKGG